jgi:exopolysaccharide biosynthesis WecB/TagA/CpsF family protein
MAVESIDGTPSLTVTRGGVICLGEFELFADGHASLRDRIAGLVEQGGTHVVVTPNVDQVLDLAGSPALQQAYGDAALRIIDGMPLVVLARALGAKRPQRHTGADLLFEAVKWSESTGWKIAIAGGDSDATAQAVERLQLLYPNASVTGIGFPYVSDVADSRSREVVDKLNALGPDIVFLCLGSPKQEKWFLQWRSELQKGVYIGAGAAVDFAAGHRSRAPKVLQVLGFEWVWRLAQEPRRLGHRYLIKGPRFLFFILTSIVRKIR